MYERTHSLELRAMGWTFRWLASCNIDEKNKYGDEKEEEKWRQAHTLKNSVIEFQSLGRARYEIAGERHKR